MPTYQNRKDAYEWDQLHEAAAMPLDRSYGRPRSSGGRALQALGGGPGDDGESQTGDMRPGLRNALADASGSEALRQLARRQPMKIDYKDGPANGPFGDRPEYYIPETMDPIANAETARQEARANFDVKEPMDAEAERRGIRNKAEGVDYGNKLAADRYWDPMTYSQREDESARKLELATAPAATAAGGKVDVAEVMKAIAAMQQPAKDAAGAGTALAGVGNATRSGVFGSDPNTNIASPPSADLLRQLIPGGQRLSPGEEAEISKGVQAGYSREEVIAHLRKLGRIK
jgi:hypothetical protein